MGFGKRVDGPGGRRETIRRTMLAPGSAMALDGSRSIVLENLSVRGAGVRGRDLPPVGTNVLLWVGDTNLFGCVAWADRERAGIMFESRLTADVVACLERGSERHLLA